jgi:hypothetical protein
MPRYSRHGTDVSKAPRRGAMVILVAIMMVFLLIIVALAVDYGFLVLVRTQLQRSADAAAMAGAWELAAAAPGGDPSEIAAAQVNARQQAAYYALLNPAANAQIVLDENLANDPVGDIVLGRLDNPSDLNEQLSFVDPDRYNTVFVCIRRDAAHLGPVSLFFGRFFGINTAPVQAQAAATFDLTSIDGFRVTEYLGPSSLLPFAVHVDDWNAMLNGAGDDNFAYDADTHTVSGGSDDLREFRLYPQTDDGHGGTVPGNFGTVNIPDGNNSNFDIMRQIEDGVSAEDLAPYGGELQLDPQTGTLPMTGDTGLSAAVQNALPTILGDARTILLYSDLQFQGANAVYTIVGFAGIRVVDYNLTGSLSNKYILVQPAVVFDHSVITTDEIGTSYYVYPPVHLTR